MAERTKRGEEDRKRDDDEMKGGLVGTATQPWDASVEAANVTRDKGREPAKDNRRDRRSVEEKR